MPLNFQPATLDNLLNGEFGIAILPTDSLLTNTERLSILDILSKTPFTFEYEPYPPCWGKAFENYLSMREYLAPEPNDDLIASLCKPINEKIVQLLTAKGIQVETLEDPTYQKTYTQADFRVNPVPANLTMLHVDDIRLDGSIKPDFVLPSALAKDDYVQLSVLIQLDDPNPVAKALRIYDKKYTSSDDKYRLENGWQFSDESVAGHNFIDYQPQIGEAFIMPNQYFHDILGGASDTNWTMYSLFILYTKETNKAYIYI